MTPSKRAPSPAWRDWDDDDEPVPPYVEPRHSPQVVRRFVDDLSETSASGYLGAANKMLYRDDDPRPGSFRWVRPGLFHDEVSALDYRVSRDSRSARWRRMIGPRKDDQPFAIETMVRLVNCASAPVGANGRWRGGKVSDITTVLGLSVDIDIALLRHENNRCDTEGRPYCPDFDQAVDLVADVPPTYAIHGGGGMPVVWLFTMPHGDIEAAHALAGDLVEHVHERCTANGWGFDSPPPLTAWLKVPGCWSSKYNLVVSILSDGERWDFEALRAAIPRYRKPHRSHGYRGLRINRARDRARALWHQTNEEQR